MDIPTLLAKAQITPDPLKDQFFLIDDVVAEQMAEEAELNDQDVVLEIGAGTGNLTRILAAKTRKVISFEIDSQFKEMLSDLPINVDLHLTDAWEFVKLQGKFLKKKEYNKIVSNLPYSFSEKFLHNLTFLEYDKVILLLPQKLVDKIETNPVFGSFFKVREIIKVPKEKFHPVPRTDSVVIELIKLEDPIANRNLPLFLRQFFYQYEESKVKNSLREGLIQYAFLVSEKRLTKNQAKKIIAEMNIDQELLEAVPGLEIYGKISEKFGEYSLGL